MKRLLTFLFVILMSHHLFAQPAGYEMVWHDEFDSTIWTPPNGDTGDWGHAAAGR